MERDEKIISEILRWRFMLGRQIKVLAGFSGQRAVDRRLKKLIEEQFITRKHILYGMPGLYTVTSRGKKFFNQALPLSQIRLDHINHDISVIDTAIYFINAYEVSAEDIKTDREIRHELGFNSNVHLPDFIYTKGKENHCVEIELSEKSKARFEAIVKENYLKYDSQKWVVPDKKSIIKNQLEQLKSKYSNIEIVSLEVVNQHVQNQKPK